MKETTRNLAVGLTMIVALGLLGGMVVFFAGTGPWQPKGYALPMEFPATGNVQVGDPVHLRGVPVGTVREVRFTQAAQPGLVKERYEVVRTHPGTHPRGRIGVRYVRRGTASAQRGAHAGQRRA